MKTCHKLLLILFCLFMGIRAFSQTEIDKKALLKQGIALNDSGKYEEALAKYSQIIKADPYFESAYYETAYTLSAQGKEKDAIPFLVKLLALNPNSADGFDMLGNIYDDIGQPDKAIEYYQQGIKADSNYQRLPFNLAITYYRIKKYPESEAAAMRAIKLDPKHASSQRVYAMATYKEKKRGASLMAWCSFLLLEPQSKRSPEAVAYVKNIVNYGISNRTDKGENILYDVNSGTSGMMMPLAVVAATQGKKNLSPLDSIQLQLTELFKIGSSIADDDQKKFSYNYYGTFFETLVTSSNMTAFTHYITLSTYKDEDLAWFKEHDKELKDFQKWLGDTKRNF